MLFGVYVWFGLQIGCAGCHKQRQVTQISLSMAFFSWVFQVFRVVDL
jgi:hypothetical protein